MVVNRGFSFSNIVGMYAIKPDRATSKDCITAIYPGNLKRIYSQNSYEEGSIAYEFAALNTNVVLSISNLVLHCEYNSKSSFHFETGISYSFRISSFNSLRIADLISSNFSSEISSIFITPFDNDFFRIICYSIRIK